MLGTNYGGHGITQSCTFALLISHFHNTKMTALDFGVRENYCHLTL
jgi:hypothetical protein